MITSDLRTEKRFSGPGLLTDHGVVSGLSVVIGPEGAPWGVLGAHTRETVEFTVDDTNFMMAVANLLWEAIRRHSTEATVRKQLAEIDAIYDSAPIGLCLLDAELRFQRVNDRLAQMNGKSVEEHLGGTIRQVVPQLADRLEPLIQGVVDRGVAAAECGSQRSGPGRVGRAAFMDRQLLAGVLRRRGDRCQRLRAGHHG